MQATSTARAGTSSKRRLNPAQRAAHRAEVAAKSLNNALSRDSVANYQAIFEGFAAKGISPDDIQPRVNVFTFNAWRALGRTVRRGEKGVPIVSVIEASKKIEGEGGDATKVPCKKPVTTYVFHISQTDELPQTKQ